jgi:hypothetical protein
LERVTIKNPGAVSDAAGDEAITLSGLNKAVTVGIDGGIAATAATGGVVAATFTSAAAGDTQKVAIGNGGKVTSLTLSTAETVEITATDNGTKANTIGTLAATAVKTLNIKGTGDLTISASDLAATVTVDASTATGKIAFTPEATTALTFKGGSGNDTLAFASGELNASDSVDLGGGTNTLSIAEALGATSTATLNAIVNGITSAQILRIAGSVTWDLSRITANKISLGSAVNTVIQKIEAADRLSVDGVTTGTLDATASLGYNTLNIDLNGGSSIAAIGNTNVTSQATINIASATTATTTAGANTIGAITNTTNASFVVTGANALTITSLSAAASFNASAATGIITVTGADAASSLVGGSANDVITGGTAAGGDTLVGGAGNDTINTAVTTGTTATTITPGLGADAVNSKGVATGNRVITYNVTAAESFATADKFDTLTFSNHTDTTTTTVTLKTGVNSATVTGATSVTVGTTAVAASSFLAVGSASATLTTTNQNFQIYQDTNGNGIIDATDFRLDVTDGAANDTTAVSIVGSDLVIVHTGVA